MRFQRVLGPVVLIAGVAVLIVGLNPAYSGADRPTWYIVGGVAAAAIGLVRVMFGGRKATTWLHQFPRLMGRAGVIYGLPDVYPAAWTSSLGGFGRRPGTIPATAVLERNCYE